MRRSHGRIARIAAAAAVLVLGPAGAPSLRAQSLGVAAVAGTGGVGAAVTMPLSSRVHLRAAGSHAAFASGVRATRGGIDFDTVREVRAGAASVAVVLWPTAWLGVAVGGWLPVGDARLTAHPAGGVAMAGTELSPSELGAVTFRLRYPETPAPTATLVLGNPVSGGLLTPQLEVGVVRTAAPTVASESFGRLDPSGAWAAHAASQLRRARWFPIVQVGLAVRINAPPDP